MQCFFVLVSLLLFIAPAAAAESYPIYWVRQTPSSANVLNTIPDEDVFNGATPESVAQFNLSASTGDFNTPAALAVLTLLMYLAIGIRQKGFRYFKHYLTPNVLFLPLNILEDFTRPGSLMIRLFFNILVGHILMGIAHAMMPFVLPIMVTFLELFVATVQAYIFAILSSVYISLLSEDHH